jgi:hypothetical protein
LKDRSGPIVKSVFSKMMGVGRATVFTVVLAMILAVVPGVATAALGAPKTIALERAAIVTYAPRHWTFIRRIANKEVDYDRSNTVKTLALWRNLASPERR